MPPINHADLKEFITIGLAGICALAYCGWQWHLIQLVVKVRSDKEQ